ncbi:hypothetical protein ABW21_db0205138 [Orbilia brochopaga]|nr:hypothetical protein ABW21_db0205138 [Drechslerella brochopaga]
MPSKRASRNNRLMHLHFQYETANIFNALIELDSDSRADPYRTWLSGAVFMTLIFDNREAQDVAMQLTSGDTESGEEVVTAIQTFSTNLVSALQYGLDSRISLTFLMILCVWLYDNPEAVNDFLNEGSTIENLLAIINQSNKADIILQGMCAFLMGVVYEFSTKESPIPRATLHPLILKRLSKDQYFHKLHKLRQHPTIRDFEVLGNKPRGKGLPEVYFTAEFIEFFKDNYSHILRSMDRDPGDPSGRLANGDSKMVSTEMLESVTAQLETKEEELTNLQAAHTALEHKLSQEQEELRRFKESSSMTVQRIKEVAAREIASARDEAQGIQEQAEADLYAEREAHRSELQEMTLRMDATLREARAATEKVTNETTAIITKLQAQNSQLQEQNSQLQKELDSLREEKSGQDQQIDNMKSAILRLESQLNEQLDNYKKLQARHESEKELYRKSAEAQLGELRQELEGRIQEATEKAEESKKRAEAAQAEVAQAKEAAKKSIEEEQQKAASAQEDMDELMLVMADLEGKKKDYKHRLKALGEEVSDDEDEEEEEEDEEEDEAEVS